MKRTIVIGDIHGCYPAYQRLLEKICFDADEDRLVLLGDIMDRGRYSWEMYQEAIRLSERMEERFVYIRGNHEALLLKCPRSITDELLWLLGGKTTAVRSFKKHGQKLYESVDWIRKQSVLFYRDTLFQCVHAGVSAERVEDDDEYTLLTDHVITKKNRYSGKLTITGHIQLREPTFFDGKGGAGTSLPCGIWKKLPETGIICIDTGCVLGNTLTACVICEDQFYLEAVRAKDIRAS